MFLREGKSVLLKYSKSIKMIMAVIKPPIIPKMFFIRVRLRGTNKNIIKSIRNKRRFGE